MAKRSINNNSKVGAVPFKTLIKLKMQINIRVICLEFNNYAKEKSRRGSTYCLHPSTVCMVCLSCSLVSANESDLSRSSVLNLNIYGMRYDLLSSHWSLIVKHVICDL